MVLSLVFDNEILRNSEDIKWNYFASLNETNNTADVTWNIDTNKESKLLSDQSIDLSVFEHIKVTEFA